MPKLDLTMQQKERLARPFVDKLFTQIEKFYENPDNEKGFREWYEQKYGEPVPQGV